MKTFIVKNKERVGKLKYIKTVKNTIDNNSVDLNIENNILITLYWVSTQYKVIL
jgi:hypothetical protein